MQSNSGIERIVETYSNSLLRIAYHHVNDLSTAQDIVQDTFIKYMAYNGTFHDLEHEKAWLFRVAINLCKNYRRHWWQSKRNELPNDMERQDKERFYVLDEVRKLPFHQKNAIYMFYYEEMSIRQIAELFKVKEGTVASWLNRGRKKLRIQLKGVWDDEEDI